MSQDGTKTGGGSGAPDKSINEQFLEKFVKLSTEQLIRGEKHANLPQYCLDLCRTYLAGIWSSAAVKSVDDIEVSPIVGGMTNQLYRVRVRDSVVNQYQQQQQATKNNKKVPTDVVIKLFQEKHMKNYHQDDVKSDSVRLADLIILAIMSQTGLGPKVYGIFKEGFIQAYHKHEPFLVKQQQNPVLLRKLASKLAQLHHLDVPIRKDVNYLIGQTKEWNEKFDQSGNKSVAKELNLALLAGSDFHAERRQVAHYFDTLLRSEKVLCHNDFRGCNLLVIKRDESGSDDDEQNTDIVIVDLEYASIDNRAQDFAQFLFEWNSAAPVNLNFVLPSAEVMANFFKLYIEECEKLEPGFAARAENSVEEMIRETKIVALGYKLFFASSFSQFTESPVPGVPFDLKQNLPLVEGFLKLYFDYKKQLQDEGIIPK